MLCLFDHRTEAVLVKQRCYSAKQFPGGFFLLFSGTQERDELPQFQNSFIVAGLRIIQARIDNEDDFLLYMVEGDYFIEQHQIHIPKILSVFHMTAGCRFAVSQIIIGEISDQSAGERRKMLKTRTFIVGQNLPEIFRWMFCMKMNAAGLNFTICAGYLQFGIKSQKCITSPGLVCLCGLQ